MAHEVFTQSTPRTSFGGMFDWYDIIATFLGGICTYVMKVAILEKKIKTKATGMNEINN
ncbi:hypothetical protein [Spirosoma sp. KCTC 42546]|uniref:hypothetical protein n=1 Tax=Spirosoma sp. KCTC 42546 TaxID=2520506 RepID=UPI00143D49F4|nr:hypothetical protein [Spirosoma sp. KCTC 42546]